MSSWLIQPTIGCDAYLPLSPFLTSRENESSVFIGCDLMRNSLTFYNANFGYTCLEICLYYVTANTQIYASKKLEVISVEETRRKKEKSFLASWIFVKYLNSQVKTKQALESPSSKGSAAGMGLVHFFPCHFCHDCGSQQLKQLMIGSQRFY